MAYYATKFVDTTYERIVARLTAANSNEAGCDWSTLRSQLLEQWDRLSDGELEATGHDRRRIAELIGYKYGVSTEMAENYLCNFERTLPLLS